MTKLFNRYLLREYLRYTLATPATLILITGFNLTLLLCTGCLAMHKLWGAIGIAGIYIVLVIIYALVSLAMFRRYKNFNK